MMTFYLCNCPPFLCITILDFFGRVKDKAGDVERILKEKDRHGIDLCP